MDNSYLYQIETHAFSESILKKARNRLRTLRISSRNLYMDIESGVHSTKGGVLSSKGRTGMIDELKELLVTIVYTEDFINTVTERMQDVD